jgi:hypothetical protein
MRLHNLLLLCTLPALLGQQTPPTLAPTQIVLVPFNQGEPKTVRVGFLVFQGTGVRLGKPVVKVTSHPRDDDQPAFLADSSGFLFASNRESAQWDIYKYVVATRTVVPVTRTPEDEVNPVATPDGRTFTVARGPERRLWRFNLDGTDAGPVPSHAGGVAAHAWFSPTVVAAVVSPANGRTGTVQLTDTSAGTTETIETGVGRSLFVRPDGSAVGFVRTVRDGSLVMREWDARTRKSRETGFALEGADEVACTPAGMLVMGHRSKLRFFEPESDRWIEFADVDQLRGRQITRMAFSPDGQWVAIVSRATAK